MPDKFELIVISPVSYLSSEADIVTKLFEQGLEGFHLRKPLWESWQAEEFLRSIPEIYHRHIVIHNHFDLVNKFALKGIHLNKENKRKFDLLKKYSVISASFHSFEEIKEEHFDYEYVFLSPVFDSISKSGHKAAFDLKSLAENIRLWHAKKPLAIKIFALGGINPQNLKIASSNGFSGAAVIGSVWNETDPLKAFTALQQALPMRNK